MSLADYLAKNYLTADQSSEKKGKKRKRKEASGLTIADDDITGWKSKKSSKKQDDEYAPTIAGQSADARFKKEKKWKVVGTLAPSNSDQAAADAILASAAKEAKQAAAADEEAPEVVDTGEGTGTGGALLMADGTAAGLQSAEQVAAALAKRQAQEQAEMDAELEENGPQETIYRDASGRVVNVQMKRAEARKALEEEERKKRKELEERKGDVQKLANAERKKELEDAKYLTVARKADDYGMNRELKEQERWNDPALGFLAKKEKKKSKTGKPLYKGAAVPNRYGIRPGHRWDGVDRGNGFEKKWFAARNRKKDLQELEYAWQMDE
ncbi:MAG: Pre-mRNA-splicing factor cwc26 [Bogoriella megaspora]|nr:MAG: Pre-mRNA-splicing factor cwc26 [Bogoriella megaspora]